MMSRFLEFAPLMGLTFPVAAALCRFRLARRLRVSYGTAMASAFIIALAYFVLLFPNTYSYNSHHDAQHKWDPDWFPSLLRYSAFVAVICFVPALAVVSCYRRRCSKGI
jgi:cellobiose-specific phosphotransferase system component IIC